MGKRPWYQNNQVSSVLYIYPPPPPPDKMTAIWADNDFKCILMNEKFGIFIEILPKFFSGSH